MEIKSNKLIVVAGMHRSGTSAITRGLKVMGVTLGDRMMPPVSGNNDKGFWEDIDLNALNVEMLDAIGSDWFHLAPIEPGDFDLLRQKGYFLSAVDLLGKKVIGTSVFGFKDPRVAKLLPFWKAVFSHCHFNVSYVLAVRHPLSVVKSLAKRDGIEAEHSYLLWLGHVIMSLIGSAGDKRILVDYDHLIQSPDRELIRIADCTGLKIDPAELQSYKTEFLDQELRHTVYELNDLLLDDTCPPIVREVYTALLDVASDRIKLDDVVLQDKVVKWFEEFERLKSPLTLVDRFRTQKTIAAQTVVERDVQIVNLNQVVVEHDAQIVKLNQAVVERDGQIVKLDQAVVERDAQIVKLDQAEVERDAQIVKLDHAVTERDGQIAALLQSVTDLKSSTSWAITRPLRFVGRRITPLANLTLKLWAPVREFLIRAARRAKLLRWYHDLICCPLFDRQWYLSQNPDVSQTKINPLWHYLVNGWKENRRSGPCFDGEYYRARYPDIAGLDQPPLLHYWLHGRHEGRHINPLLDLECLQGDTHTIKLPQQMHPKISLPVAGGVTNTQDVICISVIIPTYNRIKLLPGIIDSWRKVHSCTSFNYEIIFSDDGSSDGSVEYLESVRDLPLRVLRNAHSGASSARNAAIGAACGERLLIIGDDIFPDQEILNIHAELAQRMGPKVATLGTVNWHDDLHVNHLMKHITEIGNEQFSYNRLKDGAWTDFRHFYTCNISVDRRMLLEEKVIFDARFNEYGFEDIELGYRLALRGIKIYFTTLAKGTHYHPYNVASFCSRQTSAGRMAVVFSNIHPGVEQLLGIGALSARACKDPKSSEQDALWQSRVDMLIRRCDEYEHLVAALPEDVSMSIRQCLSSLYSRLFKAMYEYGVLDKLGNHANALAISMAYQFGKAWENYWTLLAQNIEQAIELDTNESCNLGEMLNTSNSADLFRDPKHRAMFNELIQAKPLTDLVHVAANNQNKLGRLFSRIIYYLIHDPRYLSYRAKNAFFQAIDRHPAIKPLPTNTTPVEMALPGLILEPCDTNRDAAIALFRAAFGDAALVYERMHGELLIPQLKDGGQSEPVMSSIAEATIFFWPTSIQTMPLKDQLLSAYMALVENGLSVALISHNLDLGKIVLSGTLRDHMLFSRDVSAAMFNNTLCNIPFSGKILRLLPANGASYEQKLDVLMGTPVDIDSDGFFTNCSKGGTTAIRYKVPYLPPRSKKKPVVFVFPIFLAVGGVERNTIEIMRQLNDRFCFVVVTMERLRPEQGTLAAQAHDVAAGVFEMSEIVRHADYLRVLSRLKSNLQPDLVWVCNGSPWFCDNAKYIRQIFHDVPIIDQEVYDVEQGWIARYGEAGIRSFDRFVAVNKKIEERFRRDFAIDPTRIHLIYSAIDTPLIQEFKRLVPNTAMLRAKFGLPDDKQIFTFIGRLTPQKRPLEFLKVAKKRLEHSGEYFVLVGDGELASEVQAFIIKHALKNVKRISYIENTLELHVISDGIIFTSAYEGLPIAMIEALAMGVPTLATDVGDIADVLAEYGGGAVVPVNSSTEILHEAFVDWLARRDEYAQSLKKHENDIVERFSSKSIAQQYLRCWSTAMAQYGRVTS